MTMVRKCMGHVCVYVCMCCMHVYVCVCVCVCCVCVCACAVCMCMGVFVHVCVEKGFVKNKMHGLQLCKELKHGSKHHSEFHADVRCLTNMCST